MAAINKSFVIKNGLEVSTNLIFADAPEGKVGIGTTNPEYLLHVKGGIGATNSFVSGISTTGVLHVGTAGTVITATAAGSVGLGTTNPQYKLHVIGGIGVTDSFVTGVSTVLTTLRVGTGGTVLTVLGVGNSIGVGTASPQYLFHINSPVSTGRTALYVQGDVRITGDLSVDDITFDDATLSNLTVTEALNVTSPGISTFGGYVDINSNVDISGTLNVSGISSFVGLATFGNGLRVVSGVTTLGVTTATNITAQNLYVSGIGTIINGTITNLTGTSGTITTLSSTNGTITNLTGTAATITTFNSTNSTITNLNVTGIATIATLNATGIGVTNFTVYNNLSVGGISTFTNGPVLIGSGTSTGTASQRLQVTGGTYVSGNLGIGSTNPTSKLDVIGDVRVTGVITATTFIGAFSGTVTGTATSTTNIPNLTGAITSNNTTTSLGSFSSANLATALSDKTGSGANVFATSPTLVTPVLGTPQSGTLTSCTGLPVSTGISGLAANVATFLGTPSSANLASAVTDETGTGALVFATSPTLVTPVLGAATATSIVVGSGVTINASGINAAGIITATTFIGNMNAGVGTITTLSSTNGTITNLTGTAGTITTFNSTSGTITNLTGTAATIGTVKIVSGIITATSGVVTYYGDGTYLTGTASSPNLQTVLNTGNTSSTGINVTGVITATTFVGALTGTATSTTNIPNLTGAITSNNTTTSLGSFTSSQLATALTDETGSGANVFATSPTLVTPVLGAATATSIVVGSGVTINASGINVTGVITATSYVISGGTSSQFLKADGSVDSTSYTSTGKAIAMAIVFGG